MNTRILLLAGLLLGASGCPASSCPVDDLDCFLDHLTLNQGGSPVALKGILSSALSGGTSSSARDLGTDASSPGGDLMSAPPGPSASSIGTRIGCFVDHSPSELSGPFRSTASMTLEECASFCRGQGSPYYGVQGGSICGCSVSYGALGAAPDADCYMPCAGDGSEKCGGYLRNDVYSLGGGGQGSTPVGPAPGPGGSSAVRLYCPQEAPILCGPYCCPTHAPFCCGGGCSSSEACSSIAAGKDGGVTTPSVSPAIPLSCPQTAAVSCGNGYCCDAQHPLCCPGAICSATGSCAGLERVLPPEIVDIPDSLSVDPGEPQDLDIQWNDPNGCQPSFCFNICSGGKIRCTARSRCTPSRGDGRIAGMTRMTLGYTVAPAEVWESTLGVVPVVAPGCKDPISEITGGGQVITGAGVSVGQTLTPPPSSGGGTPTPSGTCQSFSTGCGNCPNAKACVSAGASQCWYESGTGQKYNCAGCSSCTAAANALVQACCPPPK